MTDGAEPVQAGGFEGAGAAGWEAAPPSPWPAAEPSGSAQLGRVAMIMAICVIGVSVATSIVIGLTGTTIYHWSTGQSAGFNMQPNLMGAGIQFFLGTVFGTWALVQGIVATVKKRGRVFGITAIVLAAAAPIVSLMVWAAIGAVAGQHVAM